jgi:hypothetical protein
VSILLLALLLLDAWLFWLFWRAWPRFQAQSHERWERRKETEWLSRETVSFYETIPTIPCLRMADLQTIPAWPAKIKKIRLVKGHEHDRRYS